MPILGKGKKDDPLACMQQGKFKEAIKLLEAKLKKDPQNFALRVKLAEAYEGDNRKADAANIYLVEAEQRIAEGARSDGMALLRKAGRLAPDDQSLQARISKLEGSGLPQESEDGSFSFDVGGEEEAPQAKISEVQATKAPAGEPPVEPGEDQLHLDVEIVEEVEAEILPEEFPGNGSAAVTDTAGRVEEEVPADSEPEEIPATSIESSGAEVIEMGPPEPTSEPPQAVQVPPMEKAPEKREPVPASAMMPQETGPPAIELGPQETGPRPSEAFIMEPEEVAEPVAAPMGQAPVEPPSPAIPQKPVLTEALPGEIVLGEAPSEDFDLVPIDHPFEPPTSQGPAPILLASEEASAIVLMPLGDAEEMELRPVDEVPPDYAPGSIGVVPGEGESSPPPVTVVAVDESEGAEAEVLLVPAESATAEPLPCEPPPEEHETPWDYVQMLFPELTPEQLKAVQQVTIVIELPEGKVLVREGEEGDSLFIVTRGRLEARGRFEGKEIPLATFTAGDILGEVAFLKRVPRTATVTALEASAVLEMQGDLTRRELSEHPGLLNQLEIILQERVCKTLSTLKKFGKNNDGDSED